MGHVSHLEKTYSDLFCQEKYQPSVLDMYSITTNSRASISLESTWSKIDFDNKGEKMYPEFFHCRLFWRINKKYFVCTNGKYNCIEKKFFPKKNIFKSKVYIKKKCIFTKIYFYK